MWGALRRLPWCSSCQVRRSIWWRQSNQSQYKHSQQQGDGIFNSGGLVALTQKAFFISEYSLALSHSAFIIIRMIKSHYSWWLRGPSPRSEKGPDFEPPTHLMIFCLEARAIKPQAVALSLRWWRGVFKTGIIPCRPERNHMASWQTLVSGAWRSYGWELQLNIFFFFFFFKK